MAYELVIFDCDGVLVDSERIEVRLDIEMLGELGWHLSEEELISRFMGRSESVMQEAIEQHLGHPLPAGWRASERERYRRAWDRELTAVDGVVEALGRITTPVCVATSSEPDDLRYKLELTGLRERFDGALFCAAEVRRGKPAPDLFLHAARSMGAEPSRCAVVEDSAYGAAAGRAAGMDVYAYLGGLARPETLRGEATVLFDDMRQLPGLLDSARAEPRREVSRRRSRGTDR